MLFISALHDIGEDNAKSFQTVLSTFKVAHRCWFFFRSSKWGRKVKWPAHSQPAALPVMGPGHLHWSHWSLSSQWQNCPYALSPSFGMNLESDENLAWLRRYSELSGVCKVLFWFANCSQHCICGSVWVETKCIFDISFMHCCQSNGTLYYFRHFKKKGLNHYLKIPGK